MKLSVFLLCHNEEVMIPHTVRHYRDLFPSAEFTIYDNMSSDRSVEIAESLGCNVVRFDTGEEIDDFKYLEIKNNCWKSVGEGWVVVCDMDEWLDIDEESLVKEDASGVTVLTTEGYEIVSQSEAEDLSDLDLHSLRNGVRWEHAGGPNSDKRVCFKAGKISEIKYDPGAHSCSPEGRVVMSDRSYTLRHMKMLGIPYVLKINKSRHSRSERMRGMGMAIHYLQSDSDVISKFRRMLMSSKDIDNFRGASPPSSEDIDKMEKASARVGEFIDSHTDEKLLIRKYLEVCNDVLFADENFLASVTETMRSAVSSWSSRRSPVYKKAKDIVVKADLEEKDDWYVKDFGNVHHAHTSGTMTGMPFGYLRCLDVFDRIEWDCHYNLVLDEFDVPQNPHILYFFSNFYKTDGEKPICCFGGPSELAMNNHGSSRRPVVHYANFDVYKRNPDFFFNCFFAYLEDNPMDVLFTSSPQINSMCSHLRKFGIRRRLAGLLSQTNDRLLQGDARFLIDGDYFGGICDHMRCWDGGASFFTCKHGMYHLMDNLSWCEQGPNNELICTDYFNLASPFVRYWNGDYCKIEKEYSRCSCGRLYREFELLESRPFSLKGRCIAEIRDGLKRLGIRGIKQVRCSTDCLNVVSNRILEDNEKSMISALDPKFVFRFILEPD